MHNWVQQMEFESWIKSKPVQVQGEVHILSFLKLNFFIVCVCTGTHVLWRPEDNYCYTNKYILWILFSFFHFSVCVHNDVCAKGVCGGGEEH